MVEDTSFVGDGLFSDLFFISSIKGSIPRGEVASGLIWKMCKVFFSPRGHCIIGRKSCNVFSILDWENINTMYRMNSYSTIYRIGVAVCKILKHFIVEKFYVVFFQLPYSRDI